MKRLRTLLIASTLVVLVGCAPTYRECPTWSPSLTPSELSSLTPNVRSQLQVDCVYSPIMFDTLDELLETPYQIRRQILAVNTLLISMEGSPL